MSCLGDDYKEQALKESALYFWSRADLAKSVEAAVRKANEKTGQEHLKCENADVSERARASGYMFFLSAGHLAPVLYSILARRGYFPVSELGTLRQYGSRLQGHPSVDHGKECCALPWNWLAHSC